MLFNDVSFEIEKRGATQMKQFQKHEKAEVTKLDFIMPLKVSQIDTNKV